MKRLASLRPVGSAASIWLVLVCGGICRCATAAEVGPSTTVGWESEKSLVSGIQPRLGRGMYSTCFTIAHDVMGDGKWIMIVGEQFGRLHGYWWAGDKWVADRSRVNGLPDLGAYSAPAMVRNLTGDGKWTLIARNSKGDFFGYYWDAGKWVSDPARVKGLKPAAGSASLTIVDNLIGDGKRTLISGNGAGTFNGYCWDAGKWVPDPASVAGLGDVGICSRVTAGFDVFGDKKWILIAGSRWSNFTGYYRDGKKWIADPSRIKGLGDKKKRNEYSSPALAYNLRGDGKWVLITGYYVPRTGRGFFCNKVSRKRIPPIKNTTPVANATAAHIKWKYDHSWTHRVKYSTNRDMSGAAWSGWREDSNRPDVKLYGLKPKTRYYYEAYTYVPWETDVCVKSPVGSFTTPAGRKHIRLKPGESIQDAIDSLAPEGGIVKLLPGVHDVRSTIVINRNNVTIRGTHASEIRAHDPTKDVFAMHHENPLAREPWHKMPVLKNFVFKAFKVSGAFKERGRSFIHAWNVRNVTVEDILETSRLGNIISVSPTGGGSTAHSENILVKNNILSQAGINFAYSKNVRIIGNRIADACGDSGININRNNAYVYIRDNYVAGGYNFNIRGHGANHVWIENNVLVGGQRGIYNDGLSNVTMSGNTITGVSIAGIHIEPQVPRLNVKIVNNRIYNNKGHGILTTQYTHGFTKKISDIAVINNVIHGNGGDGIRMTTRWSQLDIRNNIIAGNGDYGINYRKTAQPSTIRHNDIWQNAKGEYNKTSPGVGDISADPLFADPERADFHLKSKAGRWDVKANKWIKDTAHSPCIDAGDPKTDFSKEPAPGGGRVNMGAYGNTPEASKSTDQKEQRMTGRMKKSVKPGNRHQALAKRLEEHLEKNILGFLLSHSPDAEFGGFVTQLDRQGKWYGKRVKRLVPQTRMIWTFSSAHRAGLGGGKYLKAARDGFPFLLKKMWDEKEGGWYWSVSRQGKQGSTRKSIYGQAFGIYGTCEYYFASGDKEALRKAEKTFDLLEKYAYDKKNGGYLTCNFTRDWKRRGSGDRSAGTHLHLVESLTSLVQATGKEKYRKRLKELLDILVDKIFIPELGCNVEVYTEDWKPIMGSGTAYVHDLEAAWLIIDAARALGLKGKKYLERARSLVDYSLKYGWDKKHGGFFQNGEPGRPASQTDKNYNAQGEGLVALATLYRETGDRKYFQKLQEQAKWCLEFQADSKYGEWFTMCTAEGKVKMERKAGIWKAGYHHPRGCLYAAKILQRMKKK